MKTRLPDHGPAEMPQFWRTLEERVETPEARQAAHDEFLPGAVPAGFDDVHGLPMQSGFSRRDFLGLVSATAALAATVACDRKGQGTVVPYSKRPVEVTPGVANYYASATNEGRRVYPVLVKTREGRPWPMSSASTIPTASVPPRPVGGPPVGPKPRASCTVR